MISDVTIKGSSVTFTATDNESGIAGWLINQSDTPPTDGFTSVSPANGTITKQISSLSDDIYYIWVKDQAGNVNDVKQVNFGHTFKNTTGSSWRELRFLDGPILSSEIESVTFTKSSTGHLVSDNNCWDASEGQNGNVLAWYTDDDADGFYEVTVGTPDGETPVAPRSCASLFSNIGYSGGDSMDPIHGLRTRVLGQC